MVIRQLFTTSHCAKNYFRRHEQIPAIKVNKKKMEFEKKISAYFSKHLLAFWMVALIGIPIGILLAVGIITTIFGTLILGIMSLT